MPNLATVIAVAAVVAVVALVVRYMWKERKSGGCSCGGDCGS